MANVAGGGGGRRGPYWRRQLGITQPGERTQEELNMVNMLRQRAGLAPEGGQRRAITGGVRSMLPQGAIQRSQRRAMPAQHVPRPVVPHPADIEPMVGDKTFGQGIDEMGGPYGDRASMPDPLPGHAKPMPVPGHDDLRTRLLQSVQGEQQMPQQPFQGGIRAMLQNYLQQQSLRHAQPGRGRRAILPPRPPLRRAQQSRHPY